MTRFYKNLCIVFKSNCGASIIEFAVIAPMLFTLFFGIIGWGFTMMLFNSAQFSAEQSARCVNISICKPNFNVPKTLLSDWLPNISSASYKMLSFSPLTENASAVTVTRNYTDASLTVRNYKVYCAQTKIMNPFLSDFASIPNLIKGTYCRPVNVQ